MKKLLYILMFSISCVLAESPIESYSAHLSIEDHYNSTGKRLNDVAAIIRQDRANLYNNRGDSQDKKDGFFTSSTNRALIPQLVKTSQLSSGVKEAIVRGTPFVTVKRYKNSLDVSVVTEEELGRMRTFDGITVAYCKEDFEEVDFCSQGFVDKYQEAINTHSPNFNKNYILLFIPTKNGFSEVVAIHSQNLTVLPLGVEINPEGKVAFSVKSDVILFSGEIEGYRQANSGTFTYQMIPSTDGDFGVDFTMTLE